MKSHNPSAQKHTNKKSSKIDSNRDATGLSPFTDTEAILAFNVINGVKDPKEGVEDLSVPPAPMSPISRKLQENDRTTKKPQPNVDVADLKSTQLSRPTSSGKDAQAGFVFGANLHKPGNVRIPSKVWPSGFVAGDHSTESGVAHETRLSSRTSQESLKGSNRTPLGQPKIVTAEKLPTSYQAYNDPVALDQKPVQGSEIEEGLHQTSESPPANTTKRHCQEHATKLAASLDSSDPQEQHDRALLDPQTEAATESTTTVRTDHANARIIHHEADNVDGSDPDVDPSSVAKESAESEERMIVDAANQKPVETPGISSTRPQTPATPHMQKKRSASFEILDGPTRPPRVVKATFKQSRPVSRESGTSAEEFLSSEELCDQLLARQQRLRIQAEKDHQAADKHKIRIRTLNHNLSQLERERKEAALALNNAKNAIQQADADNELLRGQLDGSLVRYRKLKDFARVLARDMQDLKRLSDKQKLEIATVRQDFDAEKRKAQEAVFTVRGMLREHMSSISTLRKDSSEMSASLQSAAIKLGEKSAKLNDELNKNRRLENHISDLQSAQIRHDKAEESNSQLIHTALNKIDTRFRDLEATIAVGPAVPPALSECLKIVQDVSRQVHVKPDDLVKLSEQVGALSNGMSQAITKLGEALATSQVANVSQIEEMLKNLKDAIDTAADKDESLRAAKIDIARLSERVIGKDAQIQQHERHQEVNKAQTDVQANGTEALLKWADNEQKKTEAQRDSAIEERNKLSIRWTSANSQLRDAQKSLEDLKIKHTQLQVSAETMNTELSGLRPRYAAACRDTAWYARRYQDVHQQYRGVCELASQRWETVNASQSQQQIFREECFSLEAKSQGLTQDLLSKKNELQDAQKKIRTQEDGLNELRQQAVKTRQDLQKSQQDLNTSKTANLQLQQANSDKANKQKEEILRLKNDLQRVSDQMKNLLLEHETSTRDCQNLRATLEVKTKEAARMQEAELRLKNFQEAVQQTQNNLESWKAQCAELDRKCQYSQEEVDRLSPLAAQAKDASVSLETLRADAEEANRKLVEIEVKLRTSKQEAAKVPDLYRDLQDSRNTVTVLQAELIEANKLDEAVQTSREEVRSLQESLRDTIAQLQKARESLQDQTVLQKSLFEKETDIFDLRQKLEAAGQVQSENEQLKKGVQQRDQSLASLRQEITQIDQLKHEAEDWEAAAKSKDIEIIQLNKELARHKQESQQFGGLATKIQSHFPHLVSDLGSQLDSIRGNVVLKDSAPNQQRVGSQILSTLLTPNTLNMLEEDVNFSQPLAQLKNHPSTITMPAASKQPRRKVAGRLGAANQIERNLYQDPLTTQPQSSGSTNVVPNSQIEVPDETLEFGERGDSDEDDSETNDSERFAQATVASPRKNTQSSMESQLRIPALRRPSPPRPSTGQTDLFNMHTATLSTDTATPVGRGKMDSQVSIFDIPPNTPRHVRFPPGTIAPQALDFNAPNPGQMLHRSQMSEISPRHLRDGTPFGPGILFTTNRGVAPLQDVPISRRNVTNAATPLTRRNKAQPNSAAKRSLELEAAPSQISTSPKRLKRMPENLEVLKGTQPTPGTSVRQPPQSSPTRGGSLTGSSAPAPSAMSKSQATKKPGRKVKNQKYEERFGASQQTG